MDEGTLRDGLRSQMHSLRLFCNAIGVPMYRAERVEFLSEMIHTCDLMIDDLAPLSEPGEDPAFDETRIIERSTPFQWRMDDKPFGLA